MYNNRDINSAHNMTPSEARLPKNVMQIKANLELRWVSNKKYPDIVVGSHVKLYRKKLLLKRKIKVFGHQRHLQLLKLLKVSIKNIII